MQPGLGWDSEPSSCKCHCCGPWVTIWPTNSDSESESRARPSAGSRATGTARGRTGRRPPIGRASALLRVRLMRPQAQSPGKFRLRVRRNRRNFKSNWVNHCDSQPQAEWHWLDRLHHLQDAQVILRNIEEYWKWLVILMNIDTYWIGKSQFWGLGILGNIE